MIKDMLSVVMDGIKDAEMMYWYGKDAYDTDRASWGDWFMNKARCRAKMVREDYDYVMNAIDMDSRVRNEDEIAMALKEYLDEQMEKINNMILR